MSGVTGETIIVWCCFFRLLCHLWVNHKQGTGFSSQDMSGVWLETKWETPRTTGSVSRIFINELQLIYCRPAFGQNFCNLVLKVYFNFFFVVFGDRSEESSNAHRKGKGAVHRLWNRIKSKLNFTSVLAVDKHEVTVYGSTRCFCEGWLWVFIS